MGIIRVLYKVFGGLRFRPEKILDPVEPSKTYKRTRKYRIEQLQKELDELTLIYNIGDIKEKMKHVDIYDKTVKNNAKADHLSSEVSLYKLQHDIKTSKELEEQYKQNPYIG